MSGSLDEAVDFLDRWYGSSPRMLVSIVPDGAVEARCFWPNSESEMRDWLRRAVAARKNLYLSINQPAWALDKKAEKRDIRTVRALHVDLDPSGDETPDECKASSLKKLQEHLPPPSVVVDSGNGVQAYWLLEEPVELDGEEEAWLRAEAYNLGLSAALGADHCHNIDRIFRLPGTLNVPNKKKLSKGRKACKTRLLTEGEWVRYPLAAFTPAPALQEPGRNARRGSVEIPGNLPRFSSTDDLPVRLLEYTVMLIVNGTDTEDPRKYRSRSEALWRVLCDMVRAGADDETIAAVIMDPDFKISSSVLDKSRPASYAADQIAGAREHAINPYLRELNQRHFVVESDRGGRCVVAEEDWDDVMSRSHIRYQSFEAFRNRYMHKPVEVGKDKDGNRIVTQLGKWWLMQEQRRQYRKIVFYPGREVPPENYNLWRGFNCEPKPGSGHLGFLEHVLQNFCSGDQKVFDYVINWTARMVQHPDTTGEVALVVKGRKGVGKGFFFRTVGSLFGQHYMQVNSPKFVVGEFNAHLRDCVFLFADEAFFAGDKKNVGVLNSLITEPTLTLEAKGIDAEPCPNFLHIGMASNEDWVVPASADERRYLVLQAGSARKQETAYFSELTRQIEAGGRENLLYYLLRRDLSGFQVRNVPQTRALSEQKTFSQRPEQAWWYHKLREGRWLQRHSTYCNSVEKDSLYDDYVNEMMRMGVPHRMSRVSLGKMIFSVSPEGWPGQEQKYVTYSGTSSRGHEYTKRERPWHYVFPGLSEMREAFTSAIGTLDEWPEPVEDEAFEEDYTQGRTDPF